jgi:hypothetical protein
VVALPWKNSQWGADHQRTAESGPGTKREFGQGHFQVGKPTSGAECRHVALVFGPLYNFFVAKFGDGF